VEATANDLASSLSRACRRQPPVRECGHRPAVQRSQAELTRTSRRVVLYSFATTRRPRQVQRLLSAGASAYLTKPFDVRELLAIIDDIVTG